MATRMSTPRAMSWRFLPIEVPPNDGRDLQMGEAAVAARALGDLAGELAGRREHQHAAGARPGAAVRLATSRSIDGSMKAAVLPVPVWAMPSRSRPVKTVGIACAWIGVGVAISLERERLEDGLRQPEGFE